MDKRLNTVLEDAILIMRQFIEKKYIEYDKAPINYDKIIDMVSIAQCPLAIKENILFLIDHVVYVAS